MIRPNRRFANGLLQVLSLCLLSLFVYLTYPLQPLNSLWYGFAIVLGLIGYTRQLLTAIFFAILLLIIYGAFVSYELFSAEILVGPTWNHFVWLFVFPFMAIVGGINREDRLPKLKSFPEEHHIQFLQEAQQERLKTILDEKLQFQSSSKSEFILQLTDVMMASQRTRSTFSVMLIQIERYQLFEHQYGAEQALHLLNRTASLLKDVIPNLLVRAYMENGLFAVIIPEDDSITPQTAQLRLDNRYRSMLLARSRQDGMVQVRLLYGSSEFPLQGVEAEALFEKALYALHSVAKDVKR